MRIIGLRVHYITDLICHIVSIEGGAYLQKVFWCHIKASIIELKKALLFAQMTQFSSVNVHIVHEVRANLAKRNDLYHSFSIKLCGWAVIIIKPPKKGLFHCPSWCLINKLYIHLPTLSFPVFTPCHSLQVRQKSSNISI